MPFVVEMGRGRENPAPPDLTMPYPTRPHHTAPDLTIPNRTKPDPRQTYPERSIDATAKRPYSPLFCGRQSPNPTREPPTSNQRRKSFSLTRSTSVSTSNVTLQGSSNLARVRRMRLRCTTTGVCHATLTASARSAWSEPSVPYRSVSQENSESTMRRPSRTRGPSLNFRAAFSIVARMAAVGTVTRCPDSQRELRDSSSTNSFFCSSVRFDSVTDVIDRIASLIGDSARPAAPQWWMIGETPLMVHRNLAVPVSIVLPFPLGALLARSASGVPFAPAIV